MAPSATSESLGKTTSICARPLQNRRKLRRFSLIQSELSVGAFRHETPRPSPKRSGFTNLAPGAVWFSGIWQHDCTPLTQGYPQDRPRQCSSNRMPLQTPPQWKGRCSHADLGKAPSFEPISSSRSARTRRPYPATEPGTQNSIAEGSGGVEKSARLSGNAVRVADG